MAGAGGDRRRRRRRSSSTWRRWRLVGVETIGVGVATLVAILAALGELASVVAGTGVWSHLVPFAAGVLGIGLVAAVALRGWGVARRRLARRARTAPPAVGVALAAVALIVSRRPAFQRQVSALGTLVGGSAEAERVTIAHQVFATYRRTDPASLARMLERARVYEPTVREAADAYGVDAEVLMGVAGAESAFHPRDSADGGRGLFQITAPPAAAVASVKQRLGVAALDPLNERHNALLAAATLRLYLDQMSGDPFLALLAYNIGPRNGGLRTIMDQYGARDFVTIQPYLQSLPRDYPIRVLSAALAYRLWRADGRLPRYEEGDNAARIQRVGIPGLETLTP